MVRDLFAAVALCGFNLSNNVLLLANILCPLFLLLVNLVRFFDKIALHLCEVLDDETKLLLMQMVPLNEVQVGQFRYAILVVF